MDDDALTEQLLSAHRERDANGAIRPNELLAAIGHRIRITLPENIPGPQNE